MEYLDSNIKAKEISSDEKLVVQNALYAIEGKRHFVPEKVKERLYLLAHTPFFLHSEEIGKAIDNFAISAPNSLVQTIPQSAYVNARYAASVHDVGKTGPADISFAAQKSVISVYSIGYVQDKLKTVQSLLSDTFGHEKAYETMKELQSCYINTRISFQDFVNLHSGWTKNVLDKYWGGQSSDKSDEDIKIINEITIIASSYHVDQGINPCNISFENNEKFPPLALLMVILDKTNASYRRSDISLQGALTKTRMAIGRRFPYYKDYVYEYFKHLGNMAKQGDFFKESFGA